MVNIVPLLFSIHRRFILNKICPFQCAALRSGDTPALECSAPNCLCLYLIAMPRVKLAVAFLPLTVGPACV